MNLPHFRTRLLRGACLRKRGKSVASFNAAYSGPGGAAGVLVPVVALCGAVWLAPAAAAQSITPQPICPPEELPVEGLCAMANLDVGYPLISSDGTVATFRPGIRWTAAGLGFLADSTMPATPTAINANGSVIVGRSEPREDEDGNIFPDDAGMIGAFRWADGSFDRLEGDAFEVDANSVALAVSGDGTVVVGSGMLREWDTTIDSPYGAGFIWTTSAPIMTPLGSLKVNPPLSEFDSPYTTALAVNASATALDPQSIVVVGISRTDNQWDEYEFGTAEAVRWTFDAQGNDIRTALPLLEPDSRTRSSSATGVSADGTVIIGGSELNGDGAPVRAVAWLGAVDDLSLDLVDLGTLNPDPFYGKFTTANAVNSNASDQDLAGIVIVGSYNTSSDNWTGQNDAIGFIESEQRAFRWTDADGMVDLGYFQTVPDFASSVPLNGTSVATAVSADGSIIVGGAVVATTVVAVDPQPQSSYYVSRAFRWTEEEGMVDLGTLFSDVPELSVVASIATGISADGSTIVGLETVVYTGDREGGLRRGTGIPFIWRTQKQDFANLMLSFPVLANETEVAVAGQQYVLGRLIDETCLAEADQACLRIGGWLVNADTATGSVGDVTSGIATLTYGRGLDSQTTVGGTLSISGTSVGGNAFDMGSGVGVSLWAEYSEGGLARTGWQAGAAIGWGRESGSITRGLDLANVMPATGDSRLETFGVRATLGYGFLQQDWLITPSLSLAHFRTSRSGYLETGSDFNASYNDLSVDRTVATLALSGERAIGEHGLISLGVGLEHDLSADPVVLTGTSTLMGMEDFSVLSMLERRETRGFLDVGYTHDLGDNRSLSASLRVAQADYGNKPQVWVGLHYAMRF